MSDSEHILVLGNGYDIPGRIRARGAKRGHSYTTSVLCRPDHLAKLEETGGHTRIVAVRGDAPVEEWIAFARAVDAAQAVTRIGTFGDQCQEIAAEVGQALSVPTHTPETVRLVFDKLTMRRRLTEAGVESTAAAEVHDPAGLRAFALAHGFPVVVKPRRGTASTGVSVIRSATEADAAFARARGADGSTEVVAEEFLAGDQYSAEAFSEDGEHVVVALTRKYSDPVSLVELGHVMPAPLQEAVAAEIRAYVAQALDALGVRFGPTHTEIVLTASGPRLLETHLRVGGDEIWNLVTDATGVDLVEYQLRQCVGEEVLPEVRALLAEPDRVQRYEAIWFAAAPAAGELVEITGTDGTFPDNVTVKVLGSPGTVLNGLHNSDSRLAWARAHADTPDKALTLAREAIGSLSFLTRITTEPCDLL